MNVKPKTVMLIVGYANYYRVVDGERLVKKRFYSVDEAKHHLCKTHKAYAFMVIHKDPFQMEQMGY